MNADNKISSKQTVRRLIVVEGRDDAALFRALCAHVGLSDFFVHEAQGEGGFNFVMKNLANGLLITPLESEKKSVPEQRVFARNLSHLLLVMDADNSAKNAFSKLEKALKAYPNRQNLALPSKPLEWSGTDGVYGLRTGIVILPIDKQDGALEDLMLGVIKPEMLSCIDGFRKCLSLADEFTGKQKMQLYLGASAQDGRRFADSFGKEDNFWNLQDPVFTPLVTFLEQAAN